MVSLRHPSANFCALSPLIYNKRGKMSCVLKGGYGARSEGLSWVWTPLVCNPRQLVTSNRSFQNLHTPRHYANKFIRGYPTMCIFKLGKLKIVSFMLVVVPPEHFTNAGLLFIKIISLVMQNISNFNGNIM